MNTKKFNIEIPKMNYEIISLTIKENGEPVKLDENDLIFMTVRPFLDSPDITFQKSLNNGITYNVDTNKYDIEIKPEDTKELKTNKEYGYDITIYIEGNKPKRKILGKFIPTDKYTLNEVV